jgi:hypothetical protein
MTQVRIRDTGEVVSRAEFRRRHPTTIFPAVLRRDVLDEFGADPVLETPKPSPNAQRNGAVQDALGNWVQAWTA